MQAPASQTHDSTLPAGWDCHVHVFNPQAPVAPGHYQPQPAALETIEQLAGDCGIRHLVLVQPSVYGTDNSLMPVSVVGGQVSTGINPQDWYAPEGSFPAYPLP